MAELTEEKRMEMEAEMNRFEQEILAPDDAPRMIIGANTFNKVQAALKAQHHTPGPHDDDSQTHSNPSAASTGTPTLLPPPPPPPILTKESTLPPPPPPPPQRPAFVPPQLRHRPPAPPPRFPPAPPMGVPPSMPPGPGSGYQPNGPPPPMFHNMGGHGPQMGPGQQMGPGSQMNLRPHMGPGPPMGRPPMGPRPHIGTPRLPFVPALNPGYYNRFEGPNNGPPPSGLSGMQETNSAVISKPKVVYSAAPVRNVPKSKDTEASEKGKRPIVSMAVEKPPSVEKPTETESESQSSASAQPQIPVMPDYSMQDLMEMPMDAELMPGHQITRKEKKEKKRKIVRTAAGQSWEDQTLGEWEQDDFRIFCGDLGNEVTDDVLAKAFSRYGSFLRAKVVRDKRTNKSKGYGFVSFKDPNDFVRAMREMNGKYVGNRPIKLRKSTWRERNLEVVRRKDKEKKLLGFR